MTPKEFSADLAITRALIEDSGVGDLVEYHLRAAGKEGADFAVARSLEALHDGRNTNNDVTGGASSTISVANVVSAAGNVDQMGGACDTAVITRAHKWNIIGDTTTFNLSIPFKDAATRGEIMPGFLDCTWLPRRVHVLNGLYSAHPAVTGGVYYALMFDKMNSLIVAWKRPLTIERYTEPREGLVGAFASGRFAPAVQHNGDYVSAITPSS